MLLDISLAPYGQEEKGLSCQLVGGLVDHRTPEPLIIIGPEPLIIIGLGCMLMSSQMEICHFSCDVFFSTPYIYICMYLYTHTHVKYIIHTETKYSFILVVLPCAACKFNCFLGYVWERPLHAAAI